MKELTERLMDHEEGLRSGAVAAICRTAIQAPEVPPRIAPSQLRPVDVFFQTLEWMISLLCDSVPAACRPLTRKSWRKSPGG